MKEEVVSFGDGCTLNGVLSRPDQGNPALPAIVILNSGLVHKVGSCRLSVQIARRFAEKGYTCLRFDLSGLGDSEAWNTSLPEDERLVAECRMAMDFLAGHVRAGNFIWYGLCSGAQNSFKTALADERVVGLAGIDNFGFRTLGYHLTHLRGVVTSDGFLMDLPFKVLRFFGRLVGIRPDNAEVAEGDEPLWFYPPKPFVEEGYGKLVDRGCQFYYLYTGGWSEEYNYAKQFYDMYPSVNFADSLKVDFKPDMSHMLFEPESQDYFIAALVDWVSERWPSGQR